MVAFLLLFLRRILPFFGKAELGGSKVSKYLSSGILVTLWLIYVTLASLKEYGIILSD
jgi:solute carrier family 8 (sodium/calcium exchanger)